MNRIFAILTAFLMLILLMGCAESSANNTPNSTDTDGVVVHEDIIEENFNNTTTIVPETKPNIDTNPNNSYTKDDYITENNNSNNNNNNTNLNSNPNPNQNTSTYTPPQTSSVASTPQETHVHTWKDATCEERKTCITCGETTGSRLEHNYTPKTCTTPETCTMCGRTRGSASKHEYFNDTCLKCGDKITIPFTVEYDSSFSYTLHGVTCYFSVEQYNIIDLDKYSEGHAMIAVTMRNDTGGKAYYNIIYYDINGRVLDTRTSHVVESAGTSGTAEGYIPINTTKIVIRAYTY